MTIVPLRNSVPLLILKSNGAPVEALEPRVTPAPTVRGAFVFRVTNGPPIRLRVVAFAPDGSESAKVNEKPDAGVTFIVPVVASVSWLDGCTKFVNDPAGV